MNLTAVEEGRSAITPHPTLSASPNPFTGSAAIRLSSPLPSHSSLSLYDAAGNLVRTLTAPGSGCAVLDGDGLKPGVYVLRADGRSTRLVKVAR